jgi:hypothetical protein
MALSTVSGILTRIGMGKLGRLGLEPVRRYERGRPGELVHVDVKKLGRFAAARHRVTGSMRRPQDPDDAAIRGRGVLGWEFVHIAINDCTRLAYAALADRAVLVVDQVLYLAPDRDLATLRLRLGLLGAVFATRLLPSILLAQPPLCGSV